MSLIFHENVSHISNLKIEFDYRAMILPHILPLEIQLAGENITIKHIYSTFCVKILFYLFSPNF